MNLTKVPQFKCPICSETIGPWIRGITIHAKKHELSTQQFYCLVHNILDIPTCNCSENCVASVTWYSWDKGFLEYAKGHYDKTIRSKNTIQQLQISHWSRGNTKENDIRLRQLGERISSTLKRRYESGELTASQLGKTCETDVGVAEATRKRTMQYAVGLHPRKLTYEDVISKLEITAANKFTFSLDRSQFESRKNNSLLLAEFTCNNCGNVMRNSVQRLMPYNGTLRCNVCEIYVSRGQSELHEFVCSLIGTQNVLSSDRTNKTGYEIDIYVPSRRFGIEYHGLFWHSTAVNDKDDYHDKKAKAATKLGITLLQVFEDEWHCKQSIVKSMIQHRLKLHTHKIGARTCTIRELSYVERKTFFDQNHIDGDVRAKGSYGLFSKDGLLVAAISFRLPFHKMPGKLEIARFACLQNTVISGALGRLMSSVKLWAKNHNFQSIITYVDTRTGDGHSYESVGFKFEKLTTPRFWWTNTIKRFDRFTTRATKNTPEAIVAEQKRVFRIYGCSNKVYSLSIL